MDAKSSQRPPARAGFTLVELLVVIIIITMLAGLAITGGNAALKAARRAVISSEIQQMTITLEKYNPDCGDYPPACHNISSPESQDAFVRHLRKRFPRYRPGSFAKKTFAAGYPEFLKIRDDMEQIYKDYEDDNKVVLPYKIDIMQLDSDSALAFFLGGLVDDDGKPCGFSANPNNPFTVGGSRIKPLFGFDETRFKPNVVAGNPDDLTDSSRRVVPLYYPKHIKNPAKTSEGVPYVYFRARSGMYGTNSNTPPLNLFQIPNVQYPGENSSERVIVVPYAQKLKSNGEIEWYKPKSFQILAAGLDGEFSESRKHTEGGSFLRYFDGDDNNLNGVEDDNLSSFTPGRIGDGVQ